MMLAVVLGLVMVAPPAAGAQLLKDPPAPEHPAPHVLVDHELSVARNTCRKNDYFFQGSIGGPKNEFTCTAFRSGVGILTVRHKKGKVYYAKVQRDAGDEEDWEYVDTLFRAIIDQFEGRLPEKRPAQSEFCEDPTYHWESGDLVVETYQCSRYIHVEALSKTMTLTAADLEK